MESRIERLPERFDLYDTGFFEDAGKFALDIDDALAPGGVGFAWHHRDRALEIVEHRNDLFEQTLCGGFPQLGALGVGSPPEVGEFGDRSLKLIEIIVAFRGDSGEFLERIEVLDLFGCIGDELFELVRIQFLVLVVH